jgi:hypothetical protein
MAAASLPQSSAPLPEIPALASGALRQDLKLMSGSLKRFLHDSWLEAPSATGEPRIRDP